MIQAKNKSLNKKLSMYLNQNLFTIINYQLEQYNVQEAFIFPHIKWSQANQEYIKQYKKLENLSKKFNNKLMEYDQQQHVYFLNPDPDQKIEFRPFIIKILQELHEKDFKHVIFPMFYYNTGDDEKKNMRDQIIMIFQESIKFLNNIKQNQSTNQYFSITLQYQKNQCFRQAALLFSRFISKTAYQKI